MNKLKELRNKVKKNNKGFSLVELIVVIVILAILIGVTIIDWDDAKKILLRLMFWLRCGCWSIAQTVYC